MGTITACPACERRERDALLIAGAIQDCRETLGRPLPEEDRESIEREESELERLLLRIVERRA